MSKFIVSHSGLKQFFSGCPAKYTFYRKYTMAVLPPWYAFGIAVHKAVEEGLHNPQDIDPRVHEVASKLLRVTKKLGYKIIDREINHIAPLTDDIWVAGRIDAVAELDGEPVLIDYKSGAHGWKSRKLEGGEVVRFQAQTTQGEIYLTPPVGREDWPVELHYMLAPTEGKTAVYKYYQNEKDRQNLIMLATLMKDASDRGWYPKMKGYQCHDCDWMHACWQTPGWEKYYLERDYNAND